MLGLNYSRLCTGTSGKDIRYNYYAMGSEYPPSAVCSTMLIFTYSVGRAWRKKSAHGRIFFFSESGSVSPMSLVNPAETAQAYASKQILPPWKHGGSFLSGQSKCSALFSRCHCCVLTGNVFFLHHINSYICKAEK